ncbi:hypothetical protein Pint_02553 [Pistacia integerrima]|uniref:Uncharacterized protein n=1 Tax=Pistacia integerrima TaxID=434235 RepID=A0ACC0ZG26_9ROSI|nr:hypothetical protein Pint_02553 [Pistacia integerrima]
MIPLGISVEGRKAIEEMAEEKCNVETETKDSNAPSVVEIKKQRGVVSHIWNSIFRLRRDDFEKRLQYISKEEAAVLARLQRRSQTWRRMTKHLIIFTVIFEVLRLDFYFDRLIIVHLDS